MPAEKKVIKYSKEWYANQADDIWDKEREQLKNPGEGDWPEMGSLGDLG
jgi:hypothetical protein